jgi:hypothetical protein
MVWCALYVGNILDTARSAAAPSTAAVTRLYLMRVSESAAERLGARSSRPEHQEQHQKHAFQRQQHGRGRSPHCGNALNEARTETALELRSFRRGVELRQ